MYVDFDKLPDNARTWVYQANRSLTDCEVKTIEDALQPALSQWAAHGQPLLASAQVAQNRFVIIGVDEGYNLPSGCSIDASVRTLQSIGRQLNQDDQFLSAEPVDFFDRSAAVELPDKSLRTFTLLNLREAINEGSLTPDTIVYNTLIKTKAEFPGNWRVRAADSWLKRYFKRSSLVE